jgi:CRP-like cAMP-binding protein
VDQTFQLFSECVLFRNLERREKDALFTRVRTRDFAAGETIFAIGSPGDSMMIVLRGTVQISVTSPKGQISVTSPKGQQHRRKVCGPPSSAPDAFDPSALEEASVPRHRATEAAGGI